MTLSEAEKILSAKAECARRKVSGTNKDCIYRNCYDCNLCYEQGTRGEQIEALELAAKTLKDSEPKFHLLCLRCRKDVGVYSIQTMEQVSYTHYSYCEDCLRKGLKMLKKADAEKANSSEIPNSSDLISRQAAIDAMEKYEKRVETAGQSWTIMCCENEILSLPSAQPERKTGHWIEHKTQIADHTVYTYECSECGNSMLVKPTRFCGHCGLKMEEANDDPE